MGRRCRSLWHGAQHVAEDRVGLDAAPGFEAAVNIAAQ
jgi:hypothetical protein